MLLPEEYQRAKSRRPVRVRASLVLTLAVGCDSGASEASKPTPRSERIGTLSAAQAETLCEEANAVARATRINERGWCALNGYGGLGSTCAERVRDCLSENWVPYQPMDGLDCSTGAILRDTACSEATAGDYIHCVAELSNRAEAVFEKASCNTDREPELARSAAPREACQAILARCPQIVPPHVLDTWLLSGESPAAFDADPLAPVFEARDRAHAELCEIALQCYPNDDCHVPANRTFWVGFDDPFFEQTKDPDEACLRRVALFEGDAVRTFGACSAEGYRALAACIKAWRCPEEASSCYDAFELAIDDCHAALPQSLLDRIDTYCDGADGLTRF